MFVFIQPWGHHILGFGCHSRNPQPRQQAPVAASCQASNSGITLGGSSSVLCWAGTGGVFT